MLYILEKMNLRSKKELAAKTLGVGKRRIIFNPNSLADIKEAITKQDIKTLFDEGIISIKPEKGRKKIKKRKSKKGPGKIRFKIKRRKQEYVKLTRKLRRYLKELKARGEVNRETYYKLRMKIRMKSFKSRFQFKEYINGLKEEVASSFFKEKEDSTFAKKQKKTVKTKKSKESKK